MEQLPRSPYEKVQGMVYFGRMIDKIRLHRAGTLRADLHANLGRGFDATCCEFLDVNYQALAEEVAHGGSDEQLFAWCCRHGHRPNPTAMKVWNWAMTRRGWRDDLSERLQQRLAEGGWAHRTDIQTFFDYIEIDEGREPRGAVVED